MGNRKKICMETFNYLKAVTRIHTVTKQKYIGGKANTNVSMTN